jgi:hypothetical protein
MMKKTLSEVLMILLILSACQKEPEWQEISTNQEPIPVKTVSRDITHDALAKVLALALTDRQVRLFLHSEIARQFTGDFDILYDLIKDKEIESEENGLVKFSELLQNKAREAGVDFSMFEDASFGYKNLQISSPVYFESWNPDTYTPLVISLPVDYQEGEGRMVSAFNANGIETLVSEEHIKEPFLLVRQAERVDAGGYMRVDPDGFVIPENEKFFSAKEVYELSVQSLKSADAVQRESVIEVLDDETLQQTLKSRRFMVESGSIAPKDKPATIIEPGLKSANSMAIEIPGNFRVNPAGPNCIQISWSQVAGAAGYEVYRQYDTWPNYLLATVGPEQINYYDQYLTIGDHYIYSVRAVDASGNSSPLTGGLESYASWRNNGSRDVVDKIYISSECWNWCCGLFDGKIELQYKTSYLLTLSNTIATYPGGSSVNNLGQKTRDQQKGKWCTYTHYLFPWDVRNYSYSYQFKLIEDDGAGDGKTIKLSATFKVQLSKIVDLSVTPAIEFKIADKDEEFGEVIIQYWDWKNGPGTYTDGYDLMPNKGIARMYLRQ